MSGLGRAHANSAYAWDSFKPDAYVQDNYARVIEDDRQILHMVRDFFIAHAPAGPASGVDVGTGANLYPMLSILPFCDEITLYELSRSNMDWLERQIPDFAPNWDPFWRELAIKPDSPYGLVDPRQAARKVRLQQGDLFDLPRRHWQIGTMFFVAESMTRQSSECTKAVEKFLDALTPGAPFAAAFMHESSGYTVGGIEFPAVPVTVDDVKTILDPLVEEGVVEPVFSGEEFRPGYTGMILALGRTRAAND